MLSTFLMRAPTPVQSKSALLGIEPHGTLLNIEVDCAREMGFAYERCLNFEKDAHAHDRVVICAARGSTRAEIRGDHPESLLLNTKKHVIIKPPGYRHSVKSLTAVYDNLALLPTPQLVRQVAEASEFSKSEIDLFLSQCWQVERSSWLNEIFERYLVNRLIYRKPESQLRFYEEEAIREVLTLALRQTSSPERIGQKIGMTGLPSLSRALETIEANLFSELTLDSLARSAGMSRASLLRAFHKECGVGPSAYIRNRRLDEASHLLENSKYSVSEVAQLVGYSDASAFCRAFKSRFRKQPRSQAQAQN
jgi:AraC-like DNA-binding protein